MKTIALVCGQRYTVFDFYNRTRDFNILFLSGGTHQKQYPIHFKKNINLIPLALKNAFLYDPTRFITNAPSNLSWKYFSNMENYLKNAHIIGLYDTYYFWNHQALKYAKKNNIPVFCEIWCNIPQHISTWLPPYSWITKEVIDYTQLFILRNHQARNFTNYLGIPETKIAYSYMGINIDHFKPSPHPKHSDRLNILYVGALLEEKGVRDLIETFAILHNKYYNCSLSIAGNGPLKDYVLQKASSLPIQYHGFIQYENLPNLYTDADIFCSPSKEKKIGPLKIWEEYFSYTLMEAQAAGLPIVSTLSGGIAEEVNNQNPLIKPGNQEQLYSALEKLILNKKLRDHLAQTNRTRAEKLFNANIQIRETEKIIKHRLL